MNVQSNSVEAPGKLYNRLSAETDQINPLSSKLVLNV